MSGRLAGKRAVIVGGGQSRDGGLGNGRAIAIRFAREGAQVFVTARRIESARMTAEHIRSELSDAKAFAYALEVTNEKEVQAMFAEADRVMGGIDIVVDNVGIMLHTDENLMTVDEATYDRMENTNEKAAMFVCRNAHPYLARHGGSIVLISSIAGVQKGCGNMYGVTKAGMNRMGEIFAGMFAGDGIRVNTIVLGLVETPMGVDFNAERTGKSREEIMAQRRDAIPLKGHCGTAWDTAAAALFLASDEAQFITGAQLPVDGGTMVCG